MRGSSSGGPVVTDAPDVTLVIACYNEEPILEASVAEIWRVLDVLRDRTEIIFVDDSSRDRTRDVIDRIIAAHPDRLMRKIEHAQNVGRGEIACGDHSRHSNDGR